jgi:hypothetical protein
MIPGWGTAPVNVNMFEHGTATKHPVVTSIKPRRSGRKRRKGVTGLRRRNKTGFDAFEVRCLVAVPE